MGTMNKETYAKLIEEDIVEMEKFMPEHSLEKKHAIDVLRWSINALYKADEVLVDLNKTNVSGSLSDFEYEMFFKSELYDFCKIDGWYPIATDSIKRPERIEEYIKNGLLRKIRQ